MKNKIPFTATTICFCVFYMIFPFTILFAQEKTVECRIIVEGISDTKVTYSYSLYFGDTLKSITRIPPGKTSDKTHFLACGNHRILLYRNDSLYHEYTNLPVDCGYKTIYTLLPERKTYYMKSERSDSKSDFGYNTTPVRENHIYEITYLQLGYGKRILETADYPVKHHFRLSVGGNMIFPIGRHPAIVYNAESNWELTTPKSDTSLTSVNIYSHERYFYWSLKMGLLLRLTAINLRANHDGGLFLDAGIEYHFPLFFRHAGLYSNKKVITRFLNRYNDLRLTARIGHDDFSVFATYRLFDFVKFDYPQLPKLAFGIQIRMPD